MKPDTVGHIESLLNEQRSFTPPDKPDAAIPSLNAYKALQQQFENDFEGSWRELALSRLKWFKLFNTVLDDSQAPFYHWFGDGTLNATENCLDRHVAAGFGERIAIVWEGEPGGVRRISYRELLHQVCQAANALRRLGVKQGDRVVIYLPMIPEAAIAMLACARIGAPHSVVFSAFSSQALGERIRDAGAKVVITADGGYRRGRIQPLKSKVDAALDADNLGVRHVMVVKRCGNPVVMKNIRDVYWQDALDEQSGHCPVVELGAEHPLFILYTSGSTGKPKGVVHSTSGYLLWAILTMEWTFDFRPAEDIHWCTADIGWITGHTYIVYGPLACGGTCLMYEGLPVHPDPGRIWKLCQDHRVSILYTAPTLIRSLIRSGDAWPAKYDLSSLRILGTVGEPINPEAWMWYYRVIGKGRCPIVDTWWQTETGGQLISPLPYATPTKPGSATLPLPGIFADVVDEEGRSMPSEEGGNLVITRPWPAMLRGIWGDPDRYVEAYWKAYGGRFYLAGDGARRDTEGYFWIMGRVDDVINVSGHRLGTMEIESALASHPEVSEAAVVGTPDELKGEAIWAFVVPKRGMDEESGLINNLRAHVAKKIGPIARPDEIRFTRGLPKTRSGKIMRRLLRDIATGREIHQDISTLENIDIIQALQKRGKQLPG